MRGEESETEDAWFLEDLTVDRWLEATKWIRNTESSFTSTCSAVHTKEAVNAPEGNLASPS